ncbi:hypothetical protein AB1Y20_003514 [Prymnesium parvum]|uniref:Uncharacterized protein n=1 Tax=Prymnesium parvum TaxID=97485 RepID=A0AB34J6Z5_PRYPA
MFLFSRNTQPNAQPSRAPTRPHPLSIKDWRFSSHVAPRPPGPESNDTFIEAAIDSLARILLHPAAAANHSCSRPPPPSPAPCTAPAFTGARRLSEARVLYVALFSFEVDLLEVLLHEIEGAVERLVLVEAPFVHQRIRRKPMLWPTLVRQPRFSRFQSMVSYVQVPMQAPTADIWHGERQATRAAGRAVVELANSLGFRLDDLIVSANTDEMLSQANLLHSHISPSHTP